uniref:Uncharacterized protein n=1 Tax=Anopheles coluzzii TaxID=1518534 RepID=A0A8W7P176_ANOCL
MHVGTFPHPAGERLYLRKETENRNSSWAESRNRNVPSGLPSSSRSASYRSILPQSGTRQWIKSTCEWMRSRPNPDRATQTPAAAAAAASSGWISLFAISRPRWTRSRE